MRVLNQLPVQLLLALSVCTLSWGGNANGIVGSVHDFTSQDWYPDITHKEICKVCHAPHDGGSDRYKSGLAWNHELSTASYVMYNNAYSSTLTNAVESQPTGNSKLCLGCHDGTVALDSFDRYAGDPGMTIGVTNPLKRVPRVLSGGDLDMRGTHPISIAYGGSDPNLKPLTTSWPGGLTIAQTLEGGKVQCATCHDVHNSSESIANTPLLRAGMTGGAASLCLTCHNK